MICNTCNTCDTVAQCTEYGCVPFSAGQAPNRTDFTTWDRKTLERFAREAADENQVLRRYLKLVPVAPRDTAPPTKTNRDQTVAVDPDYFWRPMRDCPAGVKVQLLGAGGVAAYGNYIRGDTFWHGWAPLPKEKKQ